MEVEDQREEGDGRKEESSEKGDEEGETEREWEEEGRHTYSGSYWNQIWIQLESSGPGSAPFVLGSNWNPLGILWSWALPPFLM